MFILARISISSWMVFTGQGHFNSENVEISISFMKNNHQRVDSNYIAHIFCARGKIFYDFYDYEKRDLVTLHVEDFSEALKNYNKEIILKGKECD